jgi:hypothetical protein
MTATLVVSGGGQWELVLAPCHNNTNIIPACVTKSLRILPATRRDCLANLTNPSLLVSRLLISVLSYRFSLPPRPWHELTSDHNTPKRLSHSTGRSCRFPKPPSSILTFIAPPSSTPRSQSANISRLWPVRCLVSASSVHGGCTQPLRVDPHRDLRLTWHDTPKYALSAACA